MNAPAKIAISLQDAHGDAIERANAWRGRCVNLFARGEAIIGQTLIARAPGQPLPMLLSQRIARLRKAVAGTGDQEQALDEFSAFANERNAIVHGEGKVFIDRNGGWLLILRSIGRNGANEVTVMQSAAEERRRALKLTIDRLATRFTG